MARYYTKVSCLLAGAWLVGCSGGRGGVSWFEPGPLGKTLSHLSPSAGTERIELGQEIMEEPAGRLSLKAALRVSLLQNPRLSSLYYARRMKDAQRLQAGFGPNPEIAIDLAEFGGSGEFKGVGSSEFSVQLSQLVELGGKRDARVGVARLEGELSDWDYRVERLSIYMETTLAYVDVLSAQEQVKIAQESYDLSQSIYQTILDRVTAGKASTLEKNKFHIERSQAKIALFKAKRDLDTARLKLAGNWGSTQPKFQVAVGDVQRMVALPKLSLIQKKLESHPSLGRWSTEIKHRLALLQLERSMGASDLTYNVGVSRFAESNDLALAVGLSFALPITNRNQGNILNAQYEMKKASEDQKRAEIEIRNSVAETYAVLLGIYEEVNVLRDEVLPVAKASFEASREGYQQGKFSYLDVLDAQRTYFETRSRYSHVVMSYHRGLAVLESMIGEGITSDTQIKKDQQKENKNDK